MALTEQEVRKVAELARLDLTEEEVALYAPQLSAILDYIAKLNELDTEKVAPTSHALDIINVFREDVTTPDRFEPGSWQANAPAADHGHLKVPRVIEE